METINTFDTISEYIEGIKNRFSSYSVKENYYKTIKETGERYQNAKFRRIQGEQYLLFFDLLGNLNQLFEYQNALPAELKMMKECEITELDFDIKELEAELKVKKAKLRNLLESEQKSITNYKKAKEENKRLFDIVVSGNEINEQINELKKEIEDIQNRIKDIRKRKDEISSLSNEEFRRTKINGLENSDETMDIVNKLRNNRDKNLIFSSIHEDPKKVRELAKLIIRLRVAYYNILAATKFDISEVNKVDERVDYTLDIEIFDDSSIYSRNNKEFKDIDKAVKDLRSIVSSFEEEYEDFMTIISCLDVIGDGLTVYKKYRQYSEERINGLEYGAHFISSEEKDVLNYLSETHIDDFTNTGFFESNRMFDEVCFLGRELSKIKDTFLNRGRRKKIKKQIVEKQCQLYSQMDSYIYSFVENSEYLPIYLSDLDKYRTDKDFREGYVSSMKSYHLKVQQILGTIESLKNSKDRNQRILNKTIQEIKDLTGFKEIDIDTLLISGNYDELVKSIYEKAAIPVVVSVIDDFEHKSKVKAIELEANATNQTPAEVCARILEEKQESDKEEARKRGIQSIKDSLDYIKRLTN